MFDVSREEIVEGSISRALFLLSAPLVAQYFVAVAQQIVDVFWVGRLGEPAVAAVGLSAPFFGLIMVPTSVVFVGAQVNASQYVGAGDEGAARRTAVNAVLVGVALQAAVAALVFLFVPDVVALLDPSGTVASLAVTYLTMLALGSVAAAASDALEAGFVAAGDSRTTLYINVTTVAVNAILDPFLMFESVLGVDALGAGLGILGTGLATALGFVAGLLLAAAVAARGTRSFSLTTDALRFDAGHARDVLDVGGPRAGQNVARQVARLVMVAVVSLVGGAAGLAAYTVGARIATVAFVPAQGVGQAATSIVGQNLGADRPTRARDATWLAVGVAAVGLSVFAAVQWLYPRAIVDLFVPALSGAGLRLAADYLRILAYGYWALGVIWTIEAGFNGASRTRVSMVSTMLQYWAVRVPIAVFASGVLGFTVAASLGVHAVFWAVTASNVAAACGLIAYFRYSANRGMLDRAAERSGSASGG